MNVLNGLTNTISYDSDLRPTSISTPNVENLAFTYDTADRITKITNGMSGSYTQTLGHYCDVLDRLTGMQLSRGRRVLKSDPEGRHPPGAARRPPSFRRG